MNSNCSIIHVDDDPMFQEIVRGLLEDELGSYDLIQVSSLEEMRDTLNRLNTVIVAILDGNFFDIPNGKVSFQLPNAVVLAKEKGVHEIISYSSDSSSIRALPQGERPDVIIAKGVGSQDLLKTIHSIFVQINGDISFMKA